MKGPLPVDLHIENAELKPRLVVSNLLYSLATGALGVKIMPGMFDSGFVSTRSQ